MRRVLAAALIAAALAAPARATEPFAKVGTTVLSSPFTTPHPARNMAMGGAGVADPANPANVVYNPANLIGDNGVTTFYGKYRHYDLFDVHDAGVAAVHTWGSGIRGAVALRQIIQDYEPVAERTVFLPEGTGSTYEPDDGATTLALAVGVPVGGATLSLGFSTERVYENLSRDTYTAWGFDTGVRLSMPVENARGDRLVTHLGVAVLNAGDGFDFDGSHAPSPRQTRVGAGATFAGGTAVRAPFRGGDVSVVSAAVDVDIIPDDPRFDNIAALAGIELGFFESVFFRAGTSGRVVEQSPGISHGVGIAADTGPLRLRFDISTYPSRSDINEDETVWSVSLDYRPRTP